MFVWCPTLKGKQKSLGLDWVICPCCLLFLPTPTSVVTWVFRWTFSSPTSLSPSPSHVWHFRQLQAVQWLLSVLAPSTYISWRTVHSCPENCSQNPGSPVTPISLQYNPALGQIKNWLRSGSQIKASPTPFAETAIAPSICMLQSCVQSVQSLQSLQSIQSI